MSNSTKEVQETLAGALRSWQKIENASIAKTGQVIEKTTNPIVRLVMEIIQRDSQMHYRVQEWMADILEGKAISLSPDELGEVWEMIEEHISIEKRTIELANEALEAIKGSKMLVHSYLLKYLLEDEKKHDSLLEGLASIQKGMYPYA